MDIHRPRPVHGLRELLGEILTIFIGVLIALAAEALVEHIRIDQAVAFSRSDFQDEITRNRDDLARELRQSSVLQRLMERCLRDGAAYVQGKNATAPTFSFDRRFLHPRSAAWSSAVSSQMMGHFPHAEGRLLAQVYTEQASMADLEKAAEAHWYELARFSFVGRPTTTEVADSLQQIYVSYAYLRETEEAEQALMRTYDEALRMLGSERA